MQELNFTSTTLDVLQNFHNELLSKKLKERLIDIWVEDTNSTKKI
jgi:hypothetical protein